MTPFILVCHARTGASLLIDILGQHSDVLAIGELFMPDAESRLRQCSVEGRAYEDGEDGEAFLRDWVFVNRGRAAVGFKLMYYDGLEPGDPVASARRYLASRADVRVIHLYREDLLQRLVSDEIAMRTGEWSRPIGVVTPPQAVAQFALSPERCERDFAEVEARAAATRSTFGHHPFLELSYERHIATALDDTITRVWHFLELDPIPFVRRLQKQATRGPHEVLTNWAALKTHFAGTRHSAYFSTGR
jgi:hypothetical protein